MRPVYLLSLLLASQAGLTEMQVVSGTYEIMVCKAACDSNDKSRLEVLGVLVLFDQELGKDDLASFKNLGFRDVGGWGPDVPNACFKFKRLGNPDTWVGLVPKGLTHWNRAPDGGVVLGLYHSPDASYSCFMDPSPDGLRGKGHSSGGALPGKEPTADEVLANRIGPADLKQCLEARVRGHH